MNKQEYLQLDFADRANYLNQELESGNTMEQICKELNISRSNLIFSLESHGYQYSQDQIIVRKMLEQPAVAQPAYSDEIQAVIQELNVRVAHLEEIVLPNRIRRISEVDGLVLSLPESPEGMMSSRVNIEVMRQWREFTSGRKEKAKDLFSLALWEFLLNHR